MPDIALSERAAAAGLDFPTDRSTFGRARHGRVWHRMRSHWPACDQSFNVTERVEAYDIDMVSQVCSSKNCATPAPMAQFARQFTQVLDAVDVAESSTAPMLTKARAVADIVELAAQGSGPSSQWATNRAQELSLPLRAARTDDPLLPIRAAAAAMVVPSTTEFAAAGVAERPAARDALSYAWVRTLEEHDDSCSVEKVRGQLPPDTEADVDAFVAAMDAKAARVVAAADTSMWVAVAPDGVVSRYRTAVANVIPFYDWAVIATDLSLVCVVPAFIADEIVDHSGSIVASDPGSTERFGAIFDLWSELVTPSFQGRGWDEAAAGWRTAARLH